MHQANYSHAMCQTNGCGRRMLSNVAAIVAVVSLLRATKEGIGAARDGLSDDKRDSTSVSGESECYRRKTCRKRRRDFELIKFSKFARIESEPACEITRSNPPIIISEFAPSRTVLYRSHDSTAVRATTCRAGINGPTYRYHTFSLSQSILATVPTSATKAFG